MTQPPRHTEARHGILVAAAAGRLTYQSGMALSGGSFWIQLPEAERTRATGTAAESLIAKGYLRHEHPGVPRRSGTVSLTDSGRVLLGQWNDYIAARTATP